MKTVMIKIRTNAYRITMPPLFFLDEKFDVLIKSFGVRKVKQV